MCYYIISGNLWTTPFRFCLKFLYFQFTNSILNNFCIFRVSVLIFKSIRTIRVKKLETIVIKRDRQNRSFLIFRTIQLTNPKHRNTRLDFINIFFHNIYILKKFIGYIRFCIIFSILSVYMDFIQIHTENHE